MARRKRKRKRKQQNTMEYGIARILASVMLFAVVTTILIVSPEKKDVLFRVFGISETKVIPVVDSSSDVAIHILDAGQADAVLLESGGEFALIDAGLQENHYELTNYLEQAGVEKIKYLIMTHPHADHYGGMQTIVEKFPVELVIFPDFNKAAYPTAKMFENLLDAMVKHNVPAQTGKQNEVYPIGSGNITVIHDGVVNQKDYNLISLGLLFEAGGIRYLATGDGEKANEAAMLASGIDLSAQILKAGHHGSSTSSTYSFVEAVAPQFAVISCGFGNSYGHPNPDTMATFEAFGCTILRTDTDGSIVFKPDDSGGIAYQVGKTKNKAA